MIHGYMGSTMARIEYEEHLRSLARNEQRLRDFLSDEDAVWAARTAGAWRSQPIGSLMMSLRKGVASLGARLKHKPQIPLDRPLTEQKQSTVPS